MGVFLLRNPDCVFIHIPKTGGASIRHGLFHSDYEKPVFGQIPPDWDVYFKFAFVRNPYDRLVSAWKMFTAGMFESAWQYPEDGNPRLTLDAFLDIVENENVIFDERRRTFREKIRHHTIPQTHPFNCLRHANFLGRFETFEEDLKEICRRVGITSISIPRRNQTTHQHYSKYYSASNRARVAKYFAQDFEEFGYTFDDVP